MNKEILEISQWLHEKGFEADMWYQMCYINGSDSWIYCEHIIEEDYEKEVRHAITPSIDYPYFTLNRVLELLPEKIRKEEKYYVYGCEENYFKVDFYFGINKKGIGYISDNLGIKKDNAALWESVGKGSIHLSALRLLKKTVEEEYVNEKS